MAVRAAKGVSQRRPRVLRNPRGFATGFSSHFPQKQAYGLPQMQFVVEPA
jgi:hypothetical protein